MGRTAATATSPAALSPAIRLNAFNDGQSDTPSFKSRAMNTRRGGLNAGGTRDDPQDRNPGHE